MIFTCNFANWRKIPVSVFPINIAMYPPAGWDGSSYPKLFPTTEILRQYKKGEITENHYTKMYNHYVLSKLDPCEVVEDLYSLKPEETSSVVLLCYENSDKFCHRHLVSAWLKSHGMAIREFSVKKAVKNPLGLLRKYHD